MTRPKPITDREWGGPGSPDLRRDEGTGTHTEGTPWEHREKTALSQLRREASEETVLPTP